MKDYVNASGFPMLKIRDVLVPQLILGHLPFVGESYQGPQKNLEYISRFSDVKNTVKVLRIAVERYGLTVTSAGRMSSDDKLAGLFLKAVKETELVTGIEIAMIPCIQIPLAILANPVDVYRRWLTYYEIEKRMTNGELAKKYLGDPVLQCRSDWEVRFKEALQNLKPYEATEIRDLNIDYEKLDEAVSGLKDFNILFVELGSETDFLAMTGRIDLLTNVIDHIREKFGYCTILGVHHAGSTIPILEESKIEFGSYVTPINKLGVMMFPNMNATLEATKRSEKPITAIKPLAGGRIRPGNALRYVYQELGVLFCMIGVGSESEAEEDFSIALEVLKQ